MKLCFPWIIKPCKKMISWCWRDRGFIQEVILKQKITLCTTCIEKDPKFLDTGSSIKTPTISEIPGSSSFKTTNTFVTAKTTLLSLKAVVLSITNRNINVLGPSDNVPLTFLSPRPPPATAVDRKSKSFKDRKPLDSAFLSCIYLLFFFFRVKLMNLLLLYLT